MAHQSQGGENRLQGNSIGIAHIVFFVVAAAAPMTAVVGATPPAFAFGNGAGVPGSFILSGLLYLLFSVGFTAMSRHVKGAGAFYAYISRGLGPVVGIGGAFMALLAYFAVQIGIYALFGVFMAGTMEGLGIAAPWWVWAPLALIVVVLFGRRNIAISGRILGACMLAELAILLVLDIAIVVHGGAEGLSFAGFEPAQVFAPGLGATLVFVLGSYVGFEATAIFGEEARQPERTIPRATYVAVVLITLFYAFSTWAIVQFYGPSTVQQTAAASLDGFYFAAAETLLGPWAVGLMNILLLTSLFACLLSFHNTLNRYFYTLGKEGLAWAALGAVHLRHGSPHVAGVVQAVLVALILLGFALSGADAYTVVFSWMSALTVLAILAVQALVSVAVIAFFRSAPGGRPAFTTTIAPALATIGLSGAFVLVCSNLPMLTGSDSRLVMALPVLVIGLGLLGGAIALWLRAARPVLFARLGQTFE